jgi:hypothetical protein
MTKLDMLNAQWAEKFAALCALVARDLGYGELQHLSEEDRNHIEGEAKHYVELWGETLEIKTSFTIRPITPLRRLLAEYHWPFKALKRSTASQQSTNPTPPNLYAVPRTLCQRAHHPLAALSTLWMKLNL